VKKNILTLSIALWSIRLLAVSISINAPVSLFDTSITKLSIDDVQGLLKQACNCEVAINNSNADIIFQLPNIPLNTICQPNRFQQAATTPYYPYPEHDFKWKAKSQGEKIIYEEVIPYSRYSVELVRKCFCL
jgi:hypothetical protein